jgi:hypothetical protein
MEAEVAATEAEVMVVGATEAESQHGRRRVTMSITDWEWTS